MKRDLISQKPNIQIYIEAAIFVQALRNAGSSSCRLPFVFSSKSIDFEALLELVLNPTISGIKKKLYGRETTDWRSGTFWIHLHILKTWQKYRTPGLNYWILLHFTTSYLLEITVDIGIGDIEWFKIFPIITMWKNFMYPPISSTIQPLEDRSKYIHTFII